MSNYPDTSALACAFGAPAVSGTLRASAEDFRVIEIPAFEPSGEGEHCFVRVRKTNLNTADVARELAKICSLPISDVSWAGLKDRNAVTEQTFSVHLVNKPEPAWESLDSDQVKILDIQRHHRKLKKGVLKGNRFEIVVSDLQGEHDDLQQRFEQVLGQGVPNYFGEQRFGRHNGNLDKAAAMFANPKKRIKKYLRSIYLSAARSFLFNTVLNQRVQAGNWNALLHGEVCMLNNSHSIFLSTDDPELPRRLKDFDIHPTGPLWGEGELMSQAECRSLEQSIIEEYSELAQGIEKARMKQERRALRLVPKDLQMKINDNKAQFSFELSPGSYATSLLRELVSF